MFLTLLQRRRIVLEFEAPNKENLKTTSCWSAGQHTLDSKWSHSG